MTVKELKEKLGEFPDDMLVSIKTDVFYGRYTVVNSIEQATVTKDGRWENYESVVIDAW
jgi:hypothetical protein